MRRTLYLSVFILACAPTSSAQEDELQRLREELTRVQLENLTLKLRLARHAAKPDEELKILEEALDSKLAAVRAAAFRELAALNEEARKAAVPAVLKRLVGAAESFRLDAVTFLGRASSPEAQAQVLASASDPAAAVRRAAAAALKTSGHPRATETLLRLIADPDRDVRLAALDALGVARREGAVTPLVEMLAAEKDALVLEKTVDTLGTIGSPAAVDALLGLLAGTTRVTIRWSCINSLGKIGERRAGLRLLAYIDAPHPLEVRHVAIESLGKLKETAALPRLGELLRKDSEEKLRQAAATAFGLMAGVEAIESPLLASYLEDPSEAVRRAVWTAMLSLAGEGFAVNERLAAALLGRGRRAEAEQVCARLHAAKPEGDLRARALALEESVARAAFSAGDFKAALPHYRQILTLSPDRPDTARQVAACYRGLKDLDSCLKTLGELKDPEPLLDEIHAQLQAAPGEERRKSLETMLRAASVRLVEPLAGKDEATRKTSLDSVRRLGRRILLPLIQELEEGSKQTPAVLEAGAVITGIPVDPAASNGYKTTAAAWRAWLDKPR